MPVVHSAHIAGQVLYVHTCPRDPDTDCEHEGPGLDPGPYHRLEHYPAAAPAEFPGNAAEWVRYCTTDALYRMSAFSRDNNATFFLPDVVGRALGC